MPLVEVSSTQRSAKGTTQREEVIPSAGTRTGSNTLTSAVAETTPETVITNVSTKATATTSQTTQFHAGLRFSLRIPIQPRQA